MICCFEFICSKFLKYYLCFVVKSQHKKIPNFVSFKKTVPNLIFRKVSKLRYELRQNKTFTHLIIEFYCIGYSIPKLTDFSFFHLYLFDWSAKYIVAELQMCKIPIVSDGV